jgi:hypothetical protein
VAKMDIISVIPQYEGKMHVSSLQQVLINHMFPHLRAFYQNCEDRAGGHLHW